MFVAASEKCAGPGNEARVRYCLSDDTFGSDQTTLHAIHTQRGHDKQQHKQN